MEIPTGNKRFPWVWVGVGCGAITILAIVLLVLAFFSALPAIQTTLANLGLAFSQTPTPLDNPMPIPSPGSGNGPSVGSLPFKFNAVQDMASLSGPSLMDEMMAALNLNSDTDFMAPKSYTGTATLDPTSGFTVGNAWCAADSATLQQNLANMQFLLSINGNSIDLSKYPTLYFSDNQGHACAMTGILITPDGNLDRNYHIVLTQRFQKSLDDGITSSPYPAGDLKFDFSFKFQAAPGNGTQT